MWFYIGILAKPIFLRKIHGHRFLTITRHKWKLCVVFDVENLESQHNVEAEDSAPGDLQNLLCTEGSSVPNGRKVLFLEFILLIP